MWFLPNSPIIAEGEVPFGSYEVVPIHLVQAHFLKNVPKLRVVHPVAEVPVSNRELFKGMSKQLASGHRK